jgi:hypothetical protein
MPRQSVSISDQSDLFAPAPKLPEGFAYRDDIISFIEEQVMMGQQLRIPTKSAMHSNSKLANVKAKSRH